MLTLAAVAGAVAWKLGPPGSHRLDSLTLGSAWPYWAFKGSWLSQALLGLQTAGLNIRIPWSWALKSFSGALKSFSRALKSFSEALKVGITLVRPLSRYPYVEACRLQQH